MEKNNVPNYIIKYLNDAQKYHQKAEDNLQKVMDYFENKGIDLTQFDGGCNSEILRK